jgi:hypothetical protein
VATPRNSLIELVEIQGFDKLNHRGCGAIVGDSGRNTWQVEESGARRTSLIELVEIQGFDKLNHRGCGAIVGDSGRNTWRLGGSCQAKGS